MRESNRSALPGIRSVCISRGTGTVRTANRLYLRPIQICSSPCSPCYSPGDSMGLIRNTSARPRLTISRQNEDADFLYSRRSSANVRLNRERPIGSRAGQVIPQRSRNHPAAMANAAVSRKESPAASERDPSLSSVVPAFSFCDRKTSRQASRRRSAETAARLPAALRLAESRHLPPHRYSRMLPSLRRQSIKAAQILLLLFFPGYRMPPRLQHAGAAQPQMPA